MTKVRDPVARLVDVETTERLHNSDEEFDRLRREIAKAFSSQSKEEINAWMVKRSTPLERVPPRKTVVIDPDVFAPGPIRRQVRHSHDRT